MKYVIILADGMADIPVSELNNMTPLEYAKTPAMDELARGGTVGMVKTVPDSMKPGSDVAAYLSRALEPLSSMQKRAILRYL